MQQEALVENFHYLHLELEVEHLQQELQVEQKVEPLQREPVQAWT